MSLLPFWALNVVVPIQSMESQKTLGFHQKYLNLSSEDEQRPYGFGMTWGRVINDRIFIFGWTNPLRQNALVCLLWLVNTFELPLVTGNYVIGRCALTYLSKHAHSSVGGVWMFINTILLQIYFELLFISKQRTNNKFTVSVSWALRGQGILILDQGRPNRFLEGHCPAEFSSNTN